MEQGKGPIQWFPGHMARTRRKMKEALPLVDAVVELLDARIPVSSRNPDVESLTAGKPRLVLLNKADLADESATAKWVAWFAKNGVRALPVDCRSGRGLNRVVSQLREVLADTIAAWEAKGMSGRPIRAMVLGIPNVGKSSFINRMSRGSKAKTEDRPGVTRGNQWYSLPEGTLLLDTPGVLWHKFDDPQVGLHLAFTGAIRDQILDIEELACELLGILRGAYEDRLRERYKLTGEFPESTYDLLAEVGRKRGMLMAGGEVNTERAATMLLDEYREGKLGTITLEFPMT